MRHTRGPWTVTAMTFDGCGEDEVAFVVRAPGMAASAPNKRLVEAAPDMYEALRWLVHLHHGVSKGGGKPSDAEWQEAIEAGKAALAKAEGREVRDECHSATPPARA